MMGASVPYGRAPYHAPPARNWGSPPGSGATPAQRTRPIGDGPQGYNQPVGFVKAQTAQAKADTERTDEEAEQIRVEEQQRQKANMLREVSPPPFLSTISD